ncbi:Uncharacterised protein [uncultured Clostridium sp.]|nr:Uncharacterised protein [uncultured Clostridium sp.]
MEAEPLTLQELREMAGRPVYCPDADGYGIVKCETKGHWAGIPFLVGAWHEDGVAVNFEYNIKKRGLKCYRIEQVAAPEKDIPKQPINHEMGYGDTVLVCPNCGQSAIGNPFRKGYELYPHCPWCGQKLEGGADHGKEE